MPQIQIKINATISIDEGQTIDDIQEMIDNSTASLSFDDIDMDDIELQFASIEEED